MSTIRVIVAVGVAALLGILACSSPPSETVVHSVEALAAPYAAWGFDEGAGSLASDATGNGHSGAISGATWQVPGKFGDALNFHAGSNVVTVPSGAGIDNVVPFTWCAWVYPRTQGGQGDARILHKGTNSQRKQLQIDNGGTWDLSLLVDRSGSRAKATTQNNAIAANTWVYVCGTYSESDGPRIYLNGVQVSSYASRSVGSGATLTDAVDNLYIGNRGTVDKGWDGYIDEVRLYGSVISTAQMQSDMATPINHSTDAGSDASDASLESASDAPADAGADAVAETGTEASVDSASDSTPDAGSDAAVEASGDAANDVNEAATDSTVEATADAGSDAAGDATLEASSEPQPESGVDSSVEAGTTTQHYEYVVASNVIDVYDLDNGFGLVKSVTVPQLVGTGSILGAVASPANGMLYVSSGSQGTGTGHVLKYDLVRDVVVWANSYSFDVDSAALSPDGQTLYQATGALSPNSIWEIIDTTAGTVTGSINALGTGSHDTIVTLDGTKVFMGPRHSNYLVIADTTSHAILQNMGPVANGIRPFTITGAGAYAFINTDGLIGFYVGDANSGAILYTVSPPSQFTSVGGCGGSHGVSLSPDERELYLVNCSHNYVHVFDVTGLPGTAPTDVADIPLATAMTGEGWIQHTRDGRFAVVGACGDVIDTRTRTVVGNLASLQATQVFTEVDFQNGSVVFSPLSRNQGGYL